MLMQSIMARIWTTISNANFFRSLSLDRQFAKMYDTFDFGQT
jgi:hypothetical protein